MCVTPAAGPPGILLERGLLECMSPRDPPWVSVFSMAAAADLQSGANQLSMVTLGVSHYDCVVLKSCNALWARSPFAQA